ncbi:MAG: HEAT repeat domain-containing protein [Gemmataceae bacterium]|nr:HEAT repeat domain-containing protein [Gemmataceae bacterium]
MAWPHPPDFNEAIQNPRHCFADGELQQGQPAVNALGLPWPRSGNSADVYKLLCPNDQLWAIKCFTREVHGLRERYQAVSEHLQRRQMRFMVEFHYLEQGIRIHGNWYPIVKMRWVEGLQLNEFVKEYLGRPILLERLADMWVRLSQELRNADITHGDLQHGNVLLVPGSKAATLKLRLVDYDGLVVPALAQSKSGEMGHPNYQHPQRLSGGTGDGDADRFAHLVIYSAVRCLVIGGQSLWDRFDNGDNLLFREQDFREPSQSVLFRELWEGNHPLTRTLVGYLLLASRAPLHKVPLLSDLVVNGQLRFLSPGEQTRAEAMLRGDARIGKMTATMRRPRMAKPADSPSATTPMSPPTAPQATVDELIAALRDRDPRVRERAALSLAACGSEARPAIAALRDALNDSDAAVRNYAAQALFDLDPLP